MSRKQTPESFWARVNIAGLNDCWEWTGCTVDGYGRVSWGRQLYISSRVAAWLAGLVSDPSAPANMTSSNFVLHKCDNRKCCNPLHLSTGTRSENTQQAYDRGRGGLRDGEYNGRARLSDAQARTIRARVASGDRQVDVARDYGVPPVTVWRIVSGVSYR